jgi:nicotinate-nucleotide adenylyltransferase
VKLAVLGGSFDPVHIGHLSIADEVLSRFGYDRVVLVPTAVSPLKRDAAAASGDDRLRMLSASVADDPRMVVDDCEIRRGGVSYTIDTIEDIERRYRPDGKLGLIVGEDLIAAFPSWRRVDELAAKVDLLLATRDRDDDVPFAYPHQRIDNAPVRVSSRAIRRAVASGGPWRYLVPAGVRELIAQGGLYGAAVARSPYDAVIAAVERAAQAELSPGRYLHSRSVARMSADLCAVHGCDPDAGYLAGIAHDLCKEYPADELVRLAAGDGEPVSEVERAKPALLHARAAVQVLRTRFGVNDGAVHEAIRRHTFGASGMGPLAKIVYICDKIEPTRLDVSPGLRDSVRIAALDDLFAATVKDTVRYLRDRGHAVSSDTTALLDELERGKR